jgi:hypothetical protein
VWRLASGHAVLVSAKVLQYLAWLHWLAIVGEGASAPGVVCAGNHGFGSFGLLAENPAAKLGFAFAFGVGFALVGNSLVGCGCGQYQQSGGGDGF